MRRGGGGAVWGLTLGELHLCSPRGATASGGGGGRRGRPGRRGRHGRGSEGLPPNALAACTGVAAQGGVCPRTCSAGGDSETRRWGAGRRHPAGTEPVD